MPVSIVYVEGELDVVVLNAILGTRPNRPSIERGGSKGSLPPKTRDKRHTVPDAYYVRDRDFDYDPPADTSRPVVDTFDHQPGRPRELGYRWCRHSIENYLLEPKLVEAATGWFAADFEQALHAAAQRIVHYTAARWTVGIARRSLPPMHALPTRPTSLQADIEIPRDCTPQECRTWVTEHMEQFRKAIDMQLSPAAVQQALQQREQRVVALATTDDVLLWHAGKDLFAALGPVLAGRRERTPEQLRANVRDWIRNNPASALQLLTEWQGFLALMKLQTA